MPIFDGRIRVREGAEMPAKSDYAGPESRHNLNRIPMDKKEWEKFRDWCYLKHMSMGQAAGIVLRKWMKEEGII